MARGATFLEKHFTLNKAIYFPAAVGHSGSMDMDDLQHLRQMADSISILKVKADKWGAQK
jgi:sialic acid synthase SpsE